MYVFNWVMNTSTCILVFLSVKINIIVHTCTSQMCFYNFKLYLFFNCGSLCTCTYINIEWQKYMYTYTCIFVFIFWWYYTFQNKISQGASSSLQIENLFLAFHFWSDFEIIGHKYNVCRGFHGVSFLFWLSFCDVCCRYGMWQILLILWRTFLWRERQTFSRRE